MRTPLPSCHEMTRADEAAISSGTPGRELMRRAGRAAAEVILSRFPAHLERVCVVCGPGNNGGDGLVVAAELRQRGVSVSVVVAASHRYSEDFLYYFEALPCSAAVFGSSESPVKGVSVATMDETALRDELARSSLVVDALLGTGQHSNPREVIAALVRAIAARREQSRFVRVVALDLPTGVDGSAGNVYDPAVRADMTVAFQGVKRGTTQYPARDFCGEFVAVDIGIEALAATSRFSLLRSEDFHLPARAPWSHKGSFKKLLVVGGSRLMPGAGELAARAALRAGAPLVTKVSWGTVSWPEIMLHPVGPHTDVLDGGSAQSLADRIDARSVCVIGPGLTDAPECGPALQIVFERCAREGAVCVVDADGLNVISRERLTLPPQTVITPHPGEAARLLGLSVAEGESDRFATVQRLSTEYRCVAVLKGAPSVIDDGTAGWVSQIVNPYLATGGSGDVLAGIIGALMAQGASPTAAAALGVIVHGEAGHRVMKRRYGPLIASDLIDELPGVIGDCTIAVDSAL